MRTYALVVDGGEKEVDFRGQDATVSSGWAGSGRAASGLFFCARLFAPAVAEGYGAMGMIGPSTRRCTKPLPDIARGT
jgi:hypothetical protein